MKTLLILIVLILVVLVVVSLNATGDLSVVSGYEGQPTAKEVLDGFGRALKFFIETMRGS